MDPSPAAQPVASPNDAAPPPRDRLRLSFAPAAALAWLGVVLPTAIVLLLLGLRADLRERPIWDEPFMVPILQKITTGPDAWTARALIDYDDTKGPTFFQFHAAVAAGLDALQSASDRSEDSPIPLAHFRTASLIGFLLAWWPLAWIAQRAIGRRAMTPGDSRPSSGPRRRLGLHFALPIALLYITLPYNAVTAGLVMSESTFAFGVLLLAATAVYGVTRDSVGAGAASSARFGWLTPLIFGIVLAIMLHHRIHAIAWGGAAVLLVTWRLGWRRSIVWWAALMLAGVLRLPLAARWGGLVGPGYQDRYGLGVNPDAVVHLTIALLPFTLLPALWALCQRGRSERPAGGDDTGPPASRQTAFGAVALLALVGLLLGCLFPTDLSRTVDGVPHALGPTATLIALIGNWADGALNADGSAHLGPGARIVIAVSAGSGFAALGGLLAAVMIRGRQTSAPVPSAVVLAVLVVVVGLGLSGLSAGAVYDRYLAGFTLLLPIVFVWLWLPATSVDEAATAALGHGDGGVRGGRWWLTGQIMFWLMIAILHVWRWYVAVPAASEAAAAAVG